MQRRFFLRSAVAVGAIPICGVPDSAPSPPGFQLGKTPALTTVKALRKNNLEVVALHHHMLGEQPRTFSALVRSRTSHRPGKGVQGRAGSVGESPKGWYALTKPDLFLRISRT